MLGTNENLYAWMDEGFADYLGARVFAWLHKKNFFEGAEEYDRYYNLAKSRYDEPMSTHANWYLTNLAYNTNAYYKGAIFLRQLGYIVGEKNMDKIFLEYYNQWRFKHPNPNDFIRIAENVSSMQLQWYKEFMVNTTKTIDYTIDSLWEENGMSKIRIRRVGQMPMPVDVQLTFKDSSREIHTIPLNLMYGNKMPETSINTVIHDEWMWVNPTYTFEVKHKLTDFKLIEIDPTKRLADIDPANNALQLNW
jgi:aminopeptidase N